MFFYIAVIIYLFLFLLFPEINKAIMQSRRDIANLTEGTNYIWVLIITLIICFIGSASIGFPIPFPFVLFSFSNSIYLRYRNQGLIFNEIMLTFPFWMEIMGIAIAGGLGSVLGELTSLLLGKGAKILVEKTEKESKTLENVKGFGKLILEKPKGMYLYVFIAAALPIPDDPLWIALGMSEKKYKLTKLIIVGWAGKTITTTFYVMLPIMIILGFTASGIEVNDTSTVITEAIMLLVTLTIMLFILGFNWNKFLEDKRAKIRNLKN
jgi:hypothetical protein